MRVAIYCRVSKEEQNPQNQKLELEKYARAMEWQYTIFEETESTRNTRPIKNEVYQMACRKEFDLIFVWKLDRWARSIQELVNDFTMLKSHKVGFRTLRENIILDDNPANQLMVNIFCAFADFEREVIRERTKAGLNRAKAWGKIGGRHPRNCGCGIRDKDGNKHNGFMKPIKDGSNKISGWYDERTNPPQNT